MEWYYLKDVMMICYVETAGSTEQGEKGEILSRAFIIVVFMRLETSLIERRQK